MIEKPDNPLKEFLGDLRDEWERKTLLDFLRTETTRVESETNRPGWTIWAMFAAFATLISYLLSALDSATSNWHTVGILFVFLSVGYDCLSASSNALLRNPEDSESQRRFQHVNSFASRSRLYIVVVLVRLLVVYGVYKSVQFGLHPFYYKSLVIFLWINILIIVFILVLSFLRLPIQKSAITKSWWSSLIIFALTDGTGIVACAGILTELGNLSPSIQNWRVAITLVAISLVVLFLSKLRQTPALLKDLKDVERRLALGQLTISEAREKADRILYGLTFGDIVEPYIQKVLHDLDSAESLQKELTAELNVLHHELKVRSENTNKENDPFSALMLSIEEKAISGKKKKKDSDFSSQKLRNKVQIIKRIAPHLADEISVFMSEVQPSFKSASERVEQASIQALQTLSQIKKTIKEVANKDTDSN